MRWSLARLWHKQTSKQRTGQDLQYIRENQQHRQMQSRRPRSSAPRWDRWTLAISANVSCDTFRRARSTRSCSPTPSEARTLDLVGAHIEISPSASIRSRPRRLHSSSPSTTTPTPPRRRTASSTISAACARSPASTPSASTATVVVAKHLQHDCPLGDPQLLRPARSACHLRFLLVVGGPENCSGKEARRPTVGSLAGVPGVALSVPRPRPCNRRGGL